MRCHRPVAPPPPPGVNNVDVKTVVALLARPLTSAAALVVPQHQRCFFPSRRATDNAVELDGAARQLTLEHCDDPLAATHHPAMVSFDVKAAFPSVDRRALLLSDIRAGRSPVSGRRHHPPWVSRHGGCVAGLSAQPDPVHADLQGSPLEILRAAVRYSKGVHAFAHDVAVLVSHLLGLQALATPFRAWRKAKSLQLHHDTTHAVPLRPLGRRGAGCAGCLRRVLDGMPDGSAQVQITDQARYLGFQLGPGATLHSQLETAESNWMARACALGATQVSPTLTLREYRARSLACLGHVAQLVSSRPRAAETSRCSRRG